MSNSGLAEHVSVDVVAKGKWIQLENVKYRDEEGKERVWERISRTTKPKRSKADSVGVLTILKNKAEEDTYVFVRQYRPALQCHTLEFPAGLIDEDEKAEEAALRELKEETGYTGKVLKVGPAVSLDAGTSNSLMRLVYVEVDADDSRNRDIKFVPQEGEFTEVQLVKQSQIGEHFAKVDQQGDVIDSRVYAHFNTL